MKARASEVAALVQGRLVGADAALEGVSIDSRSLIARNLFVALRGERFDGHEFLRRAAELGAGAALVETPADGLEVPQLVVPDSLAALKALAAAWRLRSAAQLAAVTGSNGKTTVKEMLAAILAAQAGDPARVLATRGNLNNHIGVPLSLLGLQAAHAFAVIEMGASGPGEIALLARLARPNVGVITNAADAHIEGFGSREGVARAKGELFGDLAADGVAVINADDAYQKLWGELAGDRRQLRFGLGGRAEVTARALELGGSRTRFMLVTPQGEAAVTLPLAGRHNVVNALAAAAAASALGASLTAIAAGLAAAPPVAGRLRLRPATGGAHLIDDSYNANPASLAAALAVLAGRPGAAWLALGDMAELGADAKARHAEAGRAARAAGVSRLFATGPLAAAAVEAFGDGGAHFDDRDALAAALAAALTAGVTVLVKGSRTAGMEAVVRAIEAPASSQPGNPAGPRRSAGAAAC